MDMYDKIDCFIKKCDNIGELIALPEKISMIIENFIGEAYVPEYVQPVLFVESRFYSVIQDIPDLYVIKHAEPIGHIEKMKRMNIEFMKSFEIIKVRRYYRSDEYYASQEYKDDMLDDYNDRKRDAYKDYRDDLYDSD